MNSIQNVEVLTVFIIIRVSTTATDCAVAFHVAPQAGRTPNPDVLCNSRVKFGAFYDYLETNYGSRFDRVASGHYARVVRPSTDEIEPAAAAAGAVAALPAGASAVGTAPPAPAGAAGGNIATAAAAATAASSSAAPAVRLCLTPDAVKDQTYFLAHLSQAQLARVLFPLGTFTKAQVGSWWTWLCVDVLMQYRLCTSCRRCRSACCAPSPRRK